MGVLGLLAIGAIETLLGQLPITRRRRSGSSSSPAGRGLLMRHPFRYSGHASVGLWLGGRALLLTECGEGVVFALGMLQRDGLRPDDGVGPARISVGAWRRGFADDVGLGCFLEALGALRKTHMGAAPVGDCLTRIDRADAALSYARK